MSSSLASASVYWLYIDVCICHLFGIRCSRFGNCALCGIGVDGLLFCSYHAFTHIPKIFSIQSILACNGCAVLCALVWEPTNGATINTYIERKREEERRRERERTMNTRATDTKCKEYTHRWMRVLVLLALHFGWIFVKFSARCLFFYITSYLLEKSWCCNDSVGFDMDLHGQMWAKSTFG